MVAEVRWVVVVVDGMYPRTIPFLLGDNNTRIPLQQPWNRCTVQIPRTIVILAGDE